MRRSPNRHAHESLRDAVSVTRFWSLVDRRGPEECWTWRGDTDRNGYGIFFWQGRRVGAHELALSFTTGEKRDPSLDTCHSCDNAACVNPAHLRFDTRASNVADMLARRGPVTPNRRLTDEQIVLMRERRAAGARQKDLAAHFGVSEAHVSTIVRGQKWANVGGPIQTERKYVRGR